MTIKEWRIKYGYSQLALALALEAFALQHYPKSAKKLPQRTLCYWETGTIPRKFWLQIIDQFTGGKVTANSFAGKAETNAVTTTSYA
jgi:hypothetical protein